VAGASSVVIFSVVSVVGFIGVVVGSIVVFSIIILASSASSKGSAVDCVISGVLRRVEGSAINGCSVGLVCAGVFSVGIIIGGGVWESSPMSSASSVTCGSCFGW